MNLRNKNRLIRHLTVLLEQAKDIPEGEAGPNSETVAHHWTRKLAQLEWRADHASRILLKECIRIDNRQHIWGGQ